MRASKSTLRRTVACERLESRQLFSVVAPQFISGDVFTMTSQNGTDLFGTGPQWLITAGPNTSSSFTVSTPNGVTVNSGGTYDYEPTGKDAVLELFNHNPTGASQSCSLGTVLRFVTPTSGTYRFSGDVGHLSEVFQDGNFVITSSSTTPITPTTPTTPSMIDQQKLQDDLATLASDKAKHLQGLATDRSHAAATLFADKAAMTMARAQIHTDRHDRAALAADRLALIVATRKLHNDQVAANVAIRDENHGYAAELKLDNVRIRADKLQTRRDR